VPVARVEIDGKIARIEVPEGAREADVMAEVERIRSSMMQPGTDVPRGQDMFAPPPQQVTGGIRGFVGEVADSANRAVTGTLDLPFSTANAALRLMGSENQVPEPFTQGYEALQRRVLGGDPRPNLQEGVARDVAQAAGSLIPAAAGMVGVVRDPARASSIMQELSGLGTSVAETGRQVAGALPAIAGVQAPLVKQAAKELSVPQEIGLALKRRSGDVNTFGYKLDPQGRIREAPEHAKVAKQGFEKGFVTMVEAAPPATKAALRKMVEIVEDGQRNFERKATVRPADVAGAAVMDRVAVIRAANRAAGSQIDSVAKSLKGQRVDVQPAVGRMLENLQEMGVQYDPATGAANFKGSDFEGLPGPQRVIKNMLDRLRNTDAPDAFDVHRMKRFIDEQVTYGKAQRGLSGSAERVLKGLRADLDGILDQQFPAYNQVNQQYSETIDALDTLQSAIGSKIDLTSPSAESALGTVMRRILSNAQSRVPIEDSLYKLDMVAKRIASPQGQELVPYRAIRDMPEVKAIDLDDNLRVQMMFVDELEKRFGTAARTSLQGDLEKGIRYAAAGPRAAAVDALAAGANKLRRVNEQAAVKALRDLLREQ
jgi:hypothetical protein